MLAPQDLPIYELESRLVVLLRSQGRLIVQAPTGSGKSTQVPQMLLNHGFLGEGEVVVLQPRRLAARMLAKRVAEEVGTQLGNLVGYQIRLDSRVSEKTRIRFVTEGILLRQMVFDFTLRGVAAIVFDEFHERHLYGDISLARAMQIQQAKRDDLKIVVMSATFDIAELNSYLAPCGVLTSQGRTFPVTVEYLPNPVNFEHDPVWTVAAGECERVAVQTAGDLLVFMPGVYEINRTVQEVQGSRVLRDFICFPLHGELEPEQQDCAVACYEARKIIVSTNVAEASLTIDGITAVIDSGLARVARFDPNRGINTLLIKKISVASSDQRAGRAGRTAPGVCVRLWTEREQAQRLLQELPEVKRLDLTEVVLMLKASAIDNTVSFPWLEKPEPKALDRAETLLEDLGALHGTRKVITDVGRKMLRFPVHPRYARMLLAAQSYGCVRQIALIAALTQGRNFLLRNIDKKMEEAREELLGEERESDFFLLMRAWRYVDKANYNLDTCHRLGIHVQGVRRVGLLFEQFLEIAAAEKLDTIEQRIDGTAVRKCVLLGFSDQLARRIDRGTLRCELVHQRRGMLSRESAVQKAPLLVATEITEVEYRGKVTTLLGLCTSVEMAWLKELFPGDFTDASGVFYDETQRRVLARKEQRFRDLVLESKQTEKEPAAGEAAAILTRKVLTGHIELGEWNESVEAWITRVNCLAKWWPELEVTPVTNASRATLVEQVCYGSYSARELRDKPVMPILRDWLLPEQLAVLDKYLPERILMANGRKARMAYSKAGPPVLRARIQELYGVDSKLSLGQGRVPVKIEVLGPNQQPVQVTDDLSNFWREQYPKIKAELSRRYPCHEWH